MSLKARDAIAEGYKAFQDAYHRADSHTISRMYTEDAEFLIPEGPVIEAERQSLRLGNRFLHPRETTFGWTLASCKRRETGRMKSADLPPARPMGAFSMPANISLSGSGTLLANRRFTATSSTPMARLLTYRLVFRSIRWST